MRDSTLRRAVADDDVPPVDQYIAAQCATDDRPSRWQFERAAYRREQEKGAAR